MFRLDFCCSGDKDERLNYVLPEEPKPFFPSPLTQWPQDMDFHGETSGRREDRLNKRRHKPLKDDDPPPPPSLS
ncbi:hypothetical protein Hdeb2414_s0004g00139761 [Helianthus debilis subsp. tardiflorus]